MKYFVVLISFMLSACASQNDDFYEVWKPRYVKIVPAQPIVEEETQKEILEEIPEEIVRVTVRNPVYQAVQYLDYTEKEDRRELEALTGVDPVRIEWCAAFANAILEQSNIPSNKDHKYSLTARSFLDWGVAVEEPVMGDVVVFPRGTEGWQGHVGFYVKQQEIDGVLYYYILGGNQKNSVRVDLYRADKAIGIRRFSN